MSPVIVAFPVTSSVPPKLVSLPTSKSAVTVVFPVISVVPVTVRLAVIEALSDTSKVPVTVIFEAKVAVPVPEFKKVVSSIHEEPFQRKVALVTVPGSIPASVESLYQCPAAPPSQ